jgi:hypothetical protein
VDFDAFEVFTCSDILLYYTIIIIFLKRNTHKLYLRKFIILYFFYNSILNYKKYVFIIYLYSI